MRRFVTRLLGRFGYRLQRISPAVEGARLTSREVTDLERLVAKSSFIPGMLSPESGKFLYALCYMQRESGDVLEIGSWQGYSTSFLARAVCDSGNGSMVAIDHFRGNVGKESSYRVGREDLGDLKAGFEANLAALELRDHVELLDMANIEAAERLRGRKVRFLFIDGDHTREGVEVDIALFFPLLVPGAIVVFDDFSPEFPGLVAALDELVGKRGFRRVFAYRKTLVVSL